MNYDKIINKSLGDKWAILLGLMALYGDGEFSQQELEYLRKILLDTDKMSKKDLFNFSNIKHKDLDDLELISYERLEWIISFIKKEFLRSGNLEDEQIKSYFELITISIFEDIENMYQNKSIDRKEDAKNLILTTLKGICSSDGVVSKKESELLQIVQSNIHLDADIKKQEKERKEAAEKLKKNRELNLAIKKRNGKIVFWIVAVIIFIIVITSN